MLPTTWSPYLRSALRIVAAFSFITHGTQKLFAWPVLVAQPTVDLVSQFGLAGVLETFGGLFMLLGLFTKPIGVVLAAEMAVAYVQAHAPRNVWPILNSGELASLYGSIWLYLAATGPGPVSVDALISRRPRR